jgi:hypothetical protein
MNSNQQDLDDLENARALGKALDTDAVSEWLKQRHLNCLRIASNKDGKDRDEWVEDAAYFYAALRLVNRSAADD